MARLRYLEDVVTLGLDSVACTGCGMCVEVCPHEVFALGSGKASIADRDACIECGACAMNCPEGTIVVSPGTGCASAIIRGWITRSEPRCGPDCDPGCC